jgi:hypothetical protein
MANKTHYYQHSSHRISHPLEEQETLNPNRKKQHIHRKSSSISDPDPDPVQPP